VRCVLSAYGVWVASASVRHRCLVLRGKPEHQWESMREMVSVDLISTRCGIISKQHNCFTPNLAFGDATRICLSLLMRQHKYSPMN
jgi:hypothetical protein